ncbi:hypothetical protein COK25_29690 [Bacillus cereus]|nr:hypothetical protein CER22_25190 [Bacillus sp. K2I17]PED34441.1 hypothetical protein CON24_30230 [Bacillus cereus]PEF50172.1 hypothetical protein CON56_22770 [Bacillus thuringiensis]PEG03336.1 hypothetical protein CON54_18740 [Bacillus cereus]PER11832.1 hypothetical protein CN489_13895 [Bacillus cereus]
MASLDIFGQQRFSIQEPHLTKFIELLQNLNQNLIFVNSLSIPFLKKSSFMIKIFFTVYQIYMVKLLNQTIHYKSKICTYTE